MRLLIFLAIYGALSYGPGLEQAALTRQTVATEYPLQSITEYDCLIGLPHGYKHLIGREIWFLSDGVTYGPWLVVDVENRNHAGMMRSRRLLADITCQEMVHKHGVLFIFNHPYWRAKE